MIKLHLLRTKENSVWRKIMYKLTFLFTCLILAIPCSADMIYVDDDTSPGGDGQSWPTAYKYLQDALAISEYGDQLWVAQGIYKPDQDESGNVTADELKTNNELAQGELDFGNITKRKKDLPRTYLFKTCDGSLGVVQIADFIDSPKAVKIRHKMLQQKPLQKPDVRVEVQNSLATEVTESTENNQNPMCRLREKASMKLRSI
jgi:hypothetical protein